MNAEVRAACFEREQYVCAACRAAPATELDHFFGRKHATEKVETCWALCHDCHMRKTLNDKGRIHWFQIFARHACIHGYVEEQARALREVEWAATKQSFRSVR